ncbi:DUF5815 family protein [Haloarcula sp. NS06]|jgi:hypothetical protein|uniref:Uncharacterized protein n=5 Tax=Haloarcula TaxID=2237 RepID=Q5UXF7_HALMA|nr:MULTISPECIES: DUF5815 family protein [Haloarcula]AAV48046.1 unknown [Haloarcula marismortui ATCC 43049]AEM56219.1 conserved hypothetical protein [Haloarcula hispanica ATCC 33960]AHB65031.1 hypothetical protein HISP_03075 [Haloarcula hispanica N601]MCJ0620986.1 hypothetical protein [Haloarcula hispanica]MDQ2071252.1 DUF5815 family protein [Haloarcula sp. H-GB4]
MAEPRVPGGRESELELACGELVDTHDLHLGMREFACDCGQTHGVVLDPHPLARFVPEFLTEVLHATIETNDDYDEFTTVHLMGVVMEEFPEKVVAADTSEDGSVGFSLAWVSDFDSRRLHEIVVELLVELMEHAISHAEDDDVMAEFEEQMLQFDVDAFVEQYRDERNFDGRSDTAI